MKEQWKPVKGFEGKYIVSNFVKTIFQWTGCPECKWWDSADEWCEKHDRSADYCGGCCSPEWRGQKEE